MEMKRICSKCVMDNIGDPTISFDSDGVSNYWHEAMKKWEDEYFPNERGQKEIEKMLDTIKANGKNSEFDCIIGLSGGLDSSYLAYLASKWDLRMLAIHCDDGFDVSVGTENVDKLAKYMGIDVVELKVDLEQYYGVIAAYLRAGVPNGAAAQDNLILAGIWNLARKYNVRSFLSGINFALEGILQRGNTITNKDTTNIYDICRRFGKGASIKNLKFISPSRQDYLHWMMGISDYAPLNYVDYNMKNAIETLHNACGFEYYGGKHYENTFTKFIQQIWLVEKFNVDKRKSHYSSMIASRQMSRDEALKMLEKPVIKSEERMNIIKDISGKTGITVDEIENMLKTPGVQHNTYKTSRYLKVKNSARKLLKR